MTELAFPPPYRRDSGIYYDSLYGYVPIEPLIREGLNCVTMQRLRHIRQLSTLYLIFPSANHSRFEHSIGVYHLATKIFDVLFDKYLKFGRDSGWPPLTPTVKIALQISALFHDVGHGPWSHVYELFCRRNPAYNNCKHEKVTKRLITEGINIFNDIPKYISRLNNHIRKNNQDKLGIDLITTDNIANIATGNPPSKKEYTFLSMICSGSFDADRMDYLRRDAHYTGVDTGSIDIWQMLNHFTLYNEGGGVWTLKLDKKVGPHAEAMLTARDFAYRQTYYHKTHRAAQEMLIRGLQQFSQLKVLDPDELTMLTDSELIEAFRNCGNRLTEEIARGITYRRIYEPLPISINFYHDLDDNALIKIGGFLKLFYSDVQVNETKFNEQFKLDEKYTFISDYSIIPVTDISEFQGDDFIDLREKKCYSLFDISPYLRLIHGEYKDVISDKKINLGLRYQQQVSNIYFYLPYEYFQTIAHSILNYYYQEDLTRVVSNEMIDTLITEKYYTKWDEIFFFIIESIDMQDEAKILNLKSRFLTSMKEYIKELIFFIAT